MKQACSLLIASLLLFAFQCSDEAPAPAATTTDSLAMAIDTFCVEPVAQGDPMFATNTISDLANYRPSVDPSANQLLMVVDQLSGQVRKYDAINRYALVKSIDGTYDSQLIFFTCADLSAYVDQTVTFSGRVSSYVGPELAATGEQCYTP